MPRTQLGSESRPAQYSTRGVQINSTASQSIHQRAQSQQFGNHLGASNQRTNSHLDHFGQTHLSQNTANFQMQLTPQAKRQTFHQQDQCQNQAVNQAADIEQKMSAMLTQVPRGQGTDQSLKARQQTSGDGSISHMADGKNFRKGPDLQQYINQRTPLNIQKKQNFFTQPSSNRKQKGMLGEQPSSCKGRKTLVLDLDETLVHSQFKPVKKQDYTIPVDIEGKICNIYVLKRPGTEIFLQEMHKHFEVVIYTASLSKYANPLMDMMDTGEWCHGRLFREHCSFINGVFVKDMSLLGRNMKDVIIIDNSPTSYMLQPECGLPILSWYEEMNDRALFDLIPLLVQLSQVDDVRQAIPKFVKNNIVDFNYAFHVCSTQVKILEAVRDEPKSGTHTSPCQLQVETLTSETENSQQHDSQQSKEQVQKYQSLQTRTPMHLQANDLLSKQRPQLNSWLDSQKTSAGFKPISKSSVNHKRGHSLHNVRQEPKLIQQQCSDVAKPVTNITNIIYNFNLTPAQQTQLKESKQQQLIDHFQRNQQRPLTLKPTLAEKHSQDQTKNSYSSPNNKTLNTTDYFKVGLQKDQLSMGKAQKKQATSQRKRPQTGSLQSRQNQHDTRLPQPEVSTAKHKMSINPQKRSPNGFHYKSPSQGASATPKAQFSSTLTGFPMSNGKGMLQLEQDGSTHSRGMWQNFNTQPSSVPNKGKQRHLSPDFHIQPNPVRVNQTETPSCKKNMESYRSHSSSQHKYAKQNQPMLVVPGQDFFYKQHQRNLQLPTDPTPSQQAKDSPQGMLNMRSTLQTAQLNERYTALLNKNLENTTNLAKAMRNNKINVCDKLKNSHQNANQLMQKTGQTTHKTNKFSPKGPKNGSNYRASNGSNATAQLRIDFRDHQGIFLDVGGSPQTKIQASQSQNQRYSQSTNGNRKQSTSNRSSMNARISSSKNSLTGNEIGMFQQQFMPLTASNKGTSSTKRKGQGQIPPFQNGLLYNNLLQHQLTQQSPFQFK